MALDWKNAESGAFDWNRSFSEPDLTDPLKHLNRFTIKHPHEYISVDDLKFFRRKKPPGLCTLQPTIAHPNNTSPSEDSHTHSNICLYNKDEPVLPFGSLKSEYTKHFQHLDLNLRPRALLRRCTSLRLEGLMHHKTEHQAQYHWYSPEDCQSCRSFPVRNPENIRLGDDYNMDAEYRSSYICHPMIDRTAKILPREMFRVDNDPRASHHQPKETLERTPSEIAALNKLAEDKFRRDLAAQEQQKCHLQQRADAAVKDANNSPSEYQRQYKPYSVEKAHSIPQISHIKMHGDFVGVPEYSDSFKMYANYAKSAPIKKADNLQQSGAEAQTKNSNSATAAETNAMPEPLVVPEYHEQFCGPPKTVTRDKSLKTEDHLHPRGDFTKDIPEYYESFRDPNITEMPERGKCRESCLRLKGNIEFNPEYRSTYLDFPRSRPIVKKSTSSFRLPTSTTATSTTSTNIETKKSPIRTPRTKYKSSSPTRFTEPMLAPDMDLTATPEYRRAQYNYQLRERTPPRKILVEPIVGGNTRASSRNRKNKESSPDVTGKITQTNKRRPSRHRQSSMLEKQQPLSTQSSFENVGAGSQLKPAKFGRRASVLKNAENCRESSSIVEGNPKYALSMRQDKFNHENQDSFVVLDEPCKRTNWMKKSWYES